MCLDMMYHSSEKEKIIEALPKIFPVWKVMSKKGRTWYSWIKGEQIIGVAVNPHGIVDTSEKPDPILSGKKVYKAGFHPNKKAGCNYKPGFHAYLSKEDAILASDNLKGAVTQKFWARKAWITQVGKGCQLLGGYRQKEPTVVLSKISTYKLY